MLGDGNCFYRAIAVCSGATDDDEHANLRKIATNYVQANFQQFFDIFGDPLRDRVTDMA